MTENVARAHETRGIGDDTRVDCPQQGTIYGPHPDAVDYFQYCPYCGDRASDGDHDRGTVPGEIICPHTTMSTYRYCPGCGVNFDD